MAVPELSPVKMRNCYPAHFLREHLKLISSLRWWRQAEISGGKMGLRAVVTTMAVAMQSLNV